MSDGMVGPMVGGESAGENGGGADEANELNAAQHESPWDTHAGNCRLSECNPPGVLECRPGLERIPPVYSVVQQETLQEQHVVDSHSRYPPTPRRRDGSDLF